MTASKTAVALTANEKKRAIAQRMIEVIARDASAGKVIPGVTKAEYAQLAGELCNYFPGVRQGLTKWDTRLGKITGAGAAKPASTTRKGSATTKSGAKPASKTASKTGAKPATRTTRSAKPAGVTTRTRKPATTTKPAAPATTTNPTPAAQVA